jgi:outer membrane protein TolC
MHARLAVSRQNEEVGNVARFDVISAERDVAEAEQNLVAARSQKSLAFLALKQVLDIEPTATFTLARDASPHDASSNKRLPIRAERAPSTPQGIVDEAALEAKKRGIHYAQRSQKPSLSLGMGYSYQPNNGAFTLRSVGSATVNFNFPILEGGLSRARTQQAEAERLAAESELNRVRDQVQREVQQAYIEQQQSLARVRLAEVGLAQAREAVRLAQVRYSVGVAQSSVVSPQIEVRSAQLALLQAQTAQLNAHFDVQLAQAALDFATGIISHPAGASPAQSLRGSSRGHGTGETLPPPR